MGFCFPSTGNAISCTAFCSSSTGMAISCAAFCFPARKCDFPRGISLFLHGKCDFLRGISLFLHGKCDFLRGVVLFPHGKSDFPHGGAKSQGGYRNAVRESSLGEACLSLFPFPIFLTNPANRQLMVIQKITVEADARFLKLLQSRIVLINA
ncbi:MAG: hypothetical protein DMG17_21880 [Acidobacteria bacterium]|nr:MAG: hypothetical protein DMG17_21880 [Acidobacteriota bacterium]